MRARDDCGVCGSPKPPATDCKRCDARRKAEYKARHPDRVAASAAEYRRAAWAAGAEDRAMRRSAKGVTRPLRRAVAKAKWKASNRGAVNASTASRFAAKMRAIPPWANRFLVDEAYDLASRRTCATGISWHVDHIVPLRSPEVCGLHVEHNLRVIPGVENMRKNNKSWPDIPAGG